MGGGLGNRQGKKVMRYRLHPVEHGERGWGWGLETASHRPLVHLLPIPTSHDCQPLSLDSKEELRS